MTDEQMYLFVDKTGKCFEAFQEIPDSAGEPDEYKNFVGALMRGGKEFSVGDMKVFKQDLIDAGFELGRDFYAQKVPS